MSTTARLRADIDVHQTAAANSQILERFPTNCEVEILDEQGDWVHVKPVSLKDTTSGFVPSVALIFPSEPQPPVFPDIQRGKRSVPSVPTSLKLGDFLLWVKNGGKPSWLTDADWAAMDQSQQDALKDGMLQSTQANADKWNAWQAQVAANNRQTVALMDEWVATLQGGREVYSIRDHYIYKQPAQNASYWGYVLKGQMMRWSGVVMNGQDGDISHQYYEVKFCRMSQVMSGWFRGDLAQEYFFPTDANDPDNPANSQHVFDLAKPLLRFPQDPEIAAAIALRLTGAQYIDIRNATGKSLRHFCLCGEFCVATLAGDDVVPLLHNWHTAVPQYYRVVAILTNPHEGTGVGDLQNLLSLAKLPAGQIYPSNPGTPSQIKERLNDNQFAIAGCEINSIGKVLANGKIRHWVVVEDVLPVGNNGWVRIYNPFHNQEEVYDYNTFMTSAGTGTGIWLEVLGQ